MNGVERELASILSISDSDMVQLAQEGYRQACARKKHFEDESRQKICECVSACVRIKEV